MEFGRFLFLCLVPLLATGISTYEDEGEGAAQQQLKQGKLMRTEMRAHSFVSDTDTDASSVDANIAALAASELESMEAPALLEGDDDDPDLGDDTNPITVGDGKGIEKKAQHLCPEVVSLSANETIKEVHPLAIGIYHLIRTYTDPPIYVNANRQFYMYFWQPQKMWRVGKHYSNVSAALSSNPFTEALCPDEVENWYAFTGQPSFGEWPGIDTLSGFANWTRPWHKHKHHPHGNRSNSTGHHRRHHHHHHHFQHGHDSWTTKYRIRCQKEVCPFQVRVSGAEVEQPNYMGVYTMQLGATNMRAHYENPSGKFLRYCSELQAWRMGSDVSTCAAAVASNATEKALCPMDPKDWAVLINGNWTPMIINVQPLQPPRHNRHDELKTSDEEEETEDGVPNPHKPSTKDEATADNSHTHDVVPLAKEESIRPHDPSMRPGGGKPGAQGKSNDDKNSNDKHSNNNDNNDNNNNNNQQQQKGKPGPSTQTTVTTAASQATKYVVGSVSSVDCPQGGEELTAADCQEASSTLGLQWGGSASHPELPHGCIRTISGAQNSDNTAQYNTYEWGEPSTTYVALCKKGKKGAYVKSALSATTTTEPEESNSTDDEKHRHGAGGAIAGGIIAGLILVIIIVAVIVVRRRRAAAAAAEEAKAKEGLVAGQEERYPMQGDYVLVVSLNRKGYVTAPPDENWKYIVTFEDDNTVSDLLPYEDLQLVDDGAAAGGTADPAATTTPAPAQ